jgi:nucleotide-binding universal stress UspA family protein
LDFLHREAAGIRAEHGIPVATYLAQGVTHKEIARFARDAKADLVVVGLRGGFMQELLGTGTAQRVRRRIAVPVLAVPREPRGPYRRILIATDFSPASERTAALVGRLFPKAQAHLLNVSRPPLDGMLALADAKESVREEHRRRALLHAFRGLRAFALRTGLERASLDVQLGHPAATIRESAAQLGADLLVLAPSAKAWLERVLVGSVTDAVLPQADCDILVASDAPRTRGVPQASAAPGTTLRQAANRFI